MVVWKHILLICMLIYYSRSETPPSLYPNLDIYPNTSIIFKPNTSHNISCIADKSNFDFVIRLYQINDGKYDILANTTTTVLNTVLHLTEQDDGSSLQCYIVWKYHTKSTKTIDLMLNNIPDATLEQNEIYSEPDVSSQLTWENEEASDKNPRQEKSYLFPDFSSQLSSAQAGAFGVNPTQDERYFVPDLSSQLSREKKETPPPLFPKVDINPNTSITYKPNSNHVVSCIGHNLRFNFVIRLYQIKNGKYVIRAETTGNVLKTVLQLTKQDDGSSLQCYIMWKFNTKASEKIDLILNRASAANPAQEKSYFLPDVSSRLSSAQAGAFGASPTPDERYFVTDLSSQLSRDNEETPPPLFPKVDINPNTSITYKPNSNHVVSCIGHNLRYNFVIRLYQIKNGKYVIRAETTGNVLKTVLQLTKQDDGSSLQCCIMWKFNTKASEKIDLILNRASDENPAKEESYFFPDVSSQLSSAQAGSYWGYFDSVTTTIVIIVIIIIIFFIVLRTRGQAQDFLCFDSIPSYKVNLMNFEKNLNSKFNTCDDYKRITEN